MILKKAYELTSKQKVNLAHIPTHIKPRYDSEEDYKLQLEKSVRRLSEYQENLYAEHKRSLLIIFQGMDTAGKDGAISHVMSGINPQGCWVSSFKAPNEVELSHDFLWRVYQNLPSRGKIGVFNRSYYEDLIVPRVHPEILKSVHMPENKIKAKNFWRHRYEDIMHFEKYLIRQGNEIIKIFLHISKGEQKIRLLNRFEDQSKLWKISESDVRERGFWGDYQSAYGKCFAGTAFTEAPWFIIPADDKKNARLMISEIILERLQSMNPAPPELSPERRRQLLMLRKKLV